MSEGWALLVQPLCRRSQTLSSCDAWLCVLTRHTPGSGMCLWNRAQPSGRAQEPPRRAVLGCAGSPQSRAEAVHTPPREQSTTAAKTLGVRQLSSRCKWPVGSKPRQGGSLQRGVTHVYPGCWELLCRDMLVTGPVCLDLCAMGPSTAPKPGASCEKEGELAAKNPAEPGMQVTTLLWPTLWVPLRTWNSPCICGPCQANLGASVQVHGASCSVDGFATQQSPADANVSSAT